MADFLSLISAIPSLISNFSGGTTAPYNKEQEQLAARQNQISQALMEGPQNQLYQNIYGQYQQQNRNNLAQTIAEAQGQNRMNSNMGRTPLFSQERGGENIFRTLMQQYQNQGVQADQQTRAALQGAAGPTLQGLAGYNAITPTKVAANKQENIGYQNIYDLLRGLTPSTGSMGAGNYTQQQSQQQFAQPVQPYMGFSY